MTPSFVKNGTTKVNWRNFIKGAKLARDWGASTFLITSKGEATFYPELVLEFIEEGTDAGFSIIELQTNGLNLKQLDEDGWLDKWYKAGLTTISLSCVHYEIEFNRSLISDAYPDISESVKILKNSNRSFCVRLSVIMVKDGIDSIGKVKNIVQFANRLGIDQVKLYSVNRPTISVNEKVAEWVDKNSIDEDFSKNLKLFLDATCFIVRKLVHGDTIYSWKDKTMTYDQNVAYGSCLTENPGNEIRQLIYCRDGHIRYSWQYQAAILF